MMCMQIVFLSVQGGQPEHIPNRHQPLRPGMQTSRTCSPHLGSSRITLRVNSRVPPRAMQQEAWLQVTLHSACLAGPYLPPYSLHFAPSCAHCCCLLAYRELDLTLVDVTADAVSPGSGNAMDLFVLTGGVIHSVDPVHPFLIISCPPKTKQNNVKKSWLLSFAR